MGILIWIALGIVAGVIAKIIMPGKDPGGWILTIILGIAGAALGGWIGTKVGWGDLSGFDLRSVGLAVLGAVILLIVYRIVFRSRG